MKLAVASVGEGIESAVDRRVGRAKHFVVDLEPDAAKTVSNAANLNATRGAGSQATGTVIDLEVKALIAGRIGSKTSAALRAKGVTTYPDEGGTSAEALDRFKAGTLDQMALAHVMEHR